MSRLDSVLRLRTIVFLYLLFTTCFALMKLDGDEVSFVRDPYEMLGGDYTRGYLQERDFASALDTARRAYYFYWKYRPINAPVIDESDRTLFAREEEKFGYHPPPDQASGDADSLHQQYADRLVVPEPDRFWVHSAGKPLLNAVLNLPALGTVLLATRGGPDLLYYQFRRDYHPVFILVRLVPILSGLIAVLVVHRMCRSRYGERDAVFAAAMTGLVPTAITYFPNIHHDALLVPFALGTALWFIRRRYVLAGISFGLALASKNSAIFLLLPVGMLTLRDCARWVRVREDAAARANALASLRGVLLMTVLGVAVLSPFANPISYATEILTPVIDRPADPRGLLFKGAMAQGEGPDAAPDRTTVDRFIYIFKSAFPFWNPMLLVILAVPMLLRRLEDDLQWFSFWMLMGMFPYALAFSHQLSYRSLFFLPFFAVLATRCFTPRQQKWALGGVLVLALWFCHDPITTGSPRIEANGKTLVQSVLSGFR